MEAGDPPFTWQPPTTVVYRRRRPSPPLFDSSLAIVLLPCLALLVLFFFIHTFNYRSQQQQQLLQQQQQQYYIPPIYQNQIPNPVPALLPQAKPAQFFRRSWDSLNVVLIIAAILCGVFARRNEDAPPPPAAVPEISRNVLRRDFPKQDHFAFSGFQHHHHQQQHLQQHQLQHQQWCQFPDNRRMYGCSPRRSFGGGGSVQPEIRGGGGLRRTSSAYPEFMRQEASLWEVEEENRRLRFFDDLQINNLYSPAESNYDRNLEEQAADVASVEEDSTAADDGIEIKEIPVDDFVASAEEEIAEASSPPQSPSPLPPMSPAPPPPPPPPSSRSKPKRTYQSVPRKEKAEKSVPPPTQPPPPSPPPPEPPQQPEKKLRRRKSNTTKEIAMVLASLYIPGKRKRKNQKKSNNHNHDHDPPLSDERAEEHHHQRRFTPPSPPPPPPPLPPPSVFSNFFKKSSKNKKIHSVSTAPPPPPPPPRRNNQISTKQNSQPTLDPPISDPPATRQTNTSSRKPPLPARPSSYYDVTGGDESPLINSGSQSPLVQIPHPPPLPPFRMSEMRFATVRDGEFVRIRSAQSSRAGSPERVGDEVDLTTTADVDKSGPLYETEINGGDSCGPTSGFTCPSPDVNTKADSFIARHHSGWRLEKLNSWREKRI